MTELIHAKTGKTDNLETIQGAFPLDPSKTYFTNNPDASTDPFTSKTNKYAESQTIEVMCQTKGCHIKFYASATLAASDAVDTNDYFIPASKPILLTIPEGKPYCRVIREDDGAKIWVRELL